jgi:hypothetical protein
MVRKVLAERLTKLRKATGKQKPRHPENCIDMRFGKGWHKRNFLGEAGFPSGKPNTPLVSINSL